MVRIATLLALALTAMLPGAPFPAAPTFQDLMAPESFPNPQRGLVVAEATLRAGVGRVVTTGAEITIKTSTGEILLAQRIGSQRPLVRLRLGKALQGGELTHSGKGFARFTFTSPKLTIRVNGTLCGRTEKPGAGYFDIDNAFDLTIGRGAQGSFYGRIADVKIYSGIVDPKQSITTEDTEITGKGGG